MHGVFLRCRFHEQVRDRCTVSYLCSLRPSLKRCPPPALAHCMLGSPWQGPLLHVPPGCSQAQRSPVGQGRHPCKATAANSMCHSLNFQCAPFLGSLISLHPLSPFGDLSVQEHPSCERNGIHVRSELFVLSQRWGQMRCCRTPISEMQGSGKQKGKTTTSSQ